MFKLGWWGQIERAIQIQNNVDNERTTIQIKMDQMGVYLFCASSLRRRDSGICGGGGRGRRRATLTPS